MKLVEYYSHLNGLEYLLVHRPALWKEVQAVIASVDAEACKTKVSKEKGMMGELKYAPKEINACFCKQLNQRKWHESRVSYWVTKMRNLSEKP